MKEILSMSYWRYRSIQKTNAEINKIKAGESIVKEGLTDSERDMIQRRKDLNKNAKQ